LFRGHEVKRISGGKQQKAEMKETEIQNEAEEKL
jgi:hypothetical protein